MVQQRKVYQKLNGFTLLELAVSLTLLSFLAASYYMTRSESGLPNQAGGTASFSKEAQTRATMRKIKKAMNRYFEANHRLPCPASNIAGLGADDGAYMGVAGGILDTPDPSVVDERANYGYACQYDSGIDSDIGLNYGGGVSSLAIPSVYAGAVPFRDLGLSKADMLDGWGHRIYYMVSVPATILANGNGNIHVLGGYDHEGAVADYIDFIGIHKDDNDEMVEEANEYALISFGEDGVGAWPAEGAASRIDSDDRALDTVSMAQNMNHHMDDLSGISYDEDVLDPVVLAGIWNGPDQYFDDIVMTGQVGQCAADWVKLQPNGMGASAGFAASTSGAYPNIMAMQGDVMVVGAPNADGLADSPNPLDDVDNVGCAYVYRHKLGQWQLEQTICGYETNAGFGASVAIDGDVLAIGEPSYEVAAGTGASGRTGRVHIYQFNNDAGPAAWEEVEILDGIYENSYSADFGFGASVALEGDVLVVGAPDSLESAYGSRSGSINIFRRDADGTWNHEKRFMKFYYNHAIFSDYYMPLYGYRGSDAREAPSAEDDDAFGQSVAINGGVIAVGAPGEDNNDDGDTTDNHGAVYLFRFDGDDWQEEERIYGLGNNYKVGADIALNGSALVLPSATSSGATRIYRYSGSSWLSGSQTLASGENYRSVALDGHDLLLGSPLNDDEASNAGAVLHYRWEYDTTNCSGGSSYYPWCWQLIDTYYAPDAVAGDNFGSAVAVSSGKIAIGAEGDGDTSAGTSDVGSLYVRDTSTRVFDQTREQQIIEADNDDNDRFGMSVDVDGEVMVAGAPRYDNGAYTVAGRAYVYRWQADDGTCPGSETYCWVREAALSPSSNVASSDNFARRNVRVDGDIIAIPAYNHDLGSAVGAVFTYHFDGDDWDEEHVINPNSISGFSASTSDRKFGEWGGLDLDGNRLAIGAEDFEDGGSSDSGMVFVFSYDGSDWNVEQQLEHPDDVSSGNFGRVVAIDGSWLAVHADRSSAGTNGYVYMYHYDASTGNWSYVQTLSGENAGDRFGYSISIDNGVMAIGAYRFDNALGENNNDGKLYIYRHNRSSGEWEEDAFFTPSDVNDEGDGDDCAYYVAVKNNVVISGCPDGTNSDNVSAGSPVTLDNQDGAVYVYRYLYNSATERYEWREVQKITPNDIADNDNFKFGISVAVSDRFLIVGDQSYSGVTTYEGAVYSYPVAECSNSAN